MKLATAAKSCKKLTDLWGLKKPPVSDSTTSVSTTKNGVFTCSVMVEKLSPKKTTGVAKKTSPGKEKTPKGFGLSSKSKSISRSKVGSTINLSSSKRKIGLPAEETKNDVIIIFEDTSRAVVKKSSKENNGLILKHPPSPKKTCLKEVNNVRVSPRNHKRVLDQGLPVVAEDGNVSKTSKGKTNHLGKPTARNIFGKESKTPVEVTVTTGTPAIEKPQEIFKDSPKPTFDSKLSKSQTNDLSKLSASNVPGEVPKPPDEVSVITPATEKPEANLKDLPKPTSVSKISKSKNNGRPIRKPQAKSIFDKAPKSPVKVAVNEEPAEVFKDLPKPTPVMCPIPQELFSDAIMIYEFLNTFGGVLDTKGYLGRQPSMEMVTKILFDSSLEGPLGKLLEMLVDAAYAGGIKISKLKESQTLPSIIYWDKVRKIPCDSYILSELVRLHIALLPKITSRKKSSSRKQQKESLELLRTKSVFELTPDERIIVIEELMHCLLRLPVYSQLAWDARCELKVSKSQLEYIKKLKMSMPANQDTIIDKLVQMKITKEAYPIEVELSADEVEESTKTEETHDDKVANPTTQTEIVTGSSMEIKTSEELASNPTESKSAVNSAGILTSVEIKPSEALMLVPTDTKSAVNFAGIPVKTKKDEAPASRVTDSKSEVHSEDHLRKKMIKEEGVQNVLDRFEKQLERQLKKFTAPLDLGYDRENRRYWVFHSMPFLFVESDSSAKNPSSLPLARESKQSLSSQDNVSAFTCQIPVDIGKDVMESYENGLLDEQKVTPNLATKPLTTGQDNVSAVNTSQIPVNNGKDEKKSSETGLLEEPKVPVTPGIATETVTRWAFYSQKESVDQLLESFSSRVFPESRLKGKMAREREHLVQLLGKSPLEDSWKNVFERKVTGRRHSTRKSSDTTPSVDAHDAMEQCLIQELMDQEEKLRVGWLGGIKENIEDWQNALQGRDYEKFTSNKTEDSRPREVAAYANALLKLKHSVRSSYFRLWFDKEPSDNFNVRTLMSQWEVYVQEATNLSQLFLCLTLFERSVHWEASLSEAHCLVCRSKKAEGMLLCDKCDNGYHMACLQPPLDKVPEDNWFCHRCEKVMVEDDNEEDCQHSADVKVMMSCLSCYGVIECCMECHDSMLPVSVLCLTCGNRTLTKRAKIITLEPKKSKNKKGKANQNRSSERIRKISLCTLATSRHDTSKESQRNTMTRRSQRNAEKKHSESLRTTKRLTRKRWSSENAQSDSDEEVVIKRTRSSRRIKADQEIQKLLDEQSKSSCSSTTGDGVLDIKVCEEIINKLILHEDGASFLMAVNPNQDRKYYTVIKNPMNLMTVRSNLRGMIYHSNSELVKDVQLIFDNCKKYYKSPRNAQYKSAQRLEALFYKLLNGNQLVSKE